eukprot:750564-Hanusia_phi.AAC.2
MAFENTFPSSADTAFHTSPPSRQAQTSELVALVCALAKIVSSQLPHTSLSTCAIVEHSRQGFTLSSITCIQFSPQAFKKLSANRLSVHDSANATDASKECECKSIFVRISDPQNTTRQDKF